LFKLKTSRSGESQIMWDNSVLRQILIQTMSSQLNLIQDDLIAENAKWWRD
jgi:hypothetical protein